MVDDAWLKAHGCGGRQAPGMSVEPSMGREPLSMHEASRIQHRYGEAFLCFLVGGFGMPFPIGTAAIHE